MLSIWLQRGMKRFGLPTTCIDARKADKSLSARFNKSDAADAEGLAQRARTNWFAPVHIRSEEADRLRSRKDLEGHIRGALKTFGIHMIGTGRGRQRQAFRDQRAIANVFIAAHATLCQSADDLGKAAKD